MQSAFDVLSNVVLTQVVVLLGCWGIFVMFQLLLSHWPHCSAPYWAIFAVQMGSCLVAEVIFLRLVRSPLSLALPFFPLIRQLLCRSHTSIPCEPCHA